MLPTWVWGGCQLIKLGENQQVEPAPKGHSLQVPAQWWVAARSQGRVNGQEEEVCMGGGAGMRPTPSADQRTLKVREGQRAQTGKGVTPKWPHSQRELS